MRTTVLGWLNHGWHAGDVTHALGGTVIPDDTEQLIVLIDGCKEGRIGDVGQRRLQVNRLIQRGTRFVFVAGPGSAATIQNSAFVHWLWSKFGFKLTPRGALEIAPEIDQRALRQFFARHLAHATLEDYDARELQDVQVLGVAVHPNGTLDGTVAGRWTDGKNEVIVVPHHTPGDLDAGDELLALLDDLPRRDEYPSYLDELELADEQALRDELESLLGRRTEVEARIDRLRRLKAILYLRGIDLEIEVVTFLSDELGQPARHVPGNREDFWLVDDDGDWCIGEVKAAENRTVDLTELGKVAIHRKEAGRDEGFPALLVANTFCARQSLAERDQGMPPNVVRRATEDRIVIVRTLDLIRLKQLALKGDDRQRDLVEACVTGGGWFEVAADLTIEVHRG